MRDLTTNALAAASAQYGSEPVNIIEVQWVENGPRTPYADKDVAQISGRILEMSKLDYIIDVTKGSDSAEIEITLSDTEGALKYIIDHFDVHKREVWVYQWFEGLTFDDLIVLFHGVINSPLIWDEGARTLKFTVINKIEDAEIGFSIEEGEFVNIPASLIGKPWPLKFGTTYNVPALQFTESVRGTLLSGVGIADYWLPLKIELPVGCPNVFVGYTTHYENISLVFDANYQRDPACEVKICQEKAEAEFKYSEQLKYQYNQFRVLDGQKFPQHIDLILDIDGAKFRGYFGDPDSRTFTVTNREHPKYAELGPPTVDNLDNILKEKDAQDLFLGCGSVNDNTSDNQDVASLYESTIAWQRFEGVPEPGFFWAQPGTVVKLAGTEEVVYASNLVPETVHRVAAYRQLNNQKHLVTVPAEYYSVRVSNFNNYNVTEIVFPEALSKIDDSWEDDIYITSTSSVGPNTVDIMEWLIGKYTNLLTDAASFNNARGRLENYPMDFPYLERKNIILALKELAFQARCAIYLRGNRFYLKYLPESPPINGTFQPSDIDPNTLELSHTSTEDIVTKFVVDWKRDYSLSDSNTAILRHNVQKYGTQERNFNFYAYNELGYVTKSATFWLIRYSNTWKKLSFTTPPNKIALETFDAATIAVPIMFPDDIIGLIEKADYDSDTRTMSFKVHTNVKSGSQTPYNFFFPADIDIQNIWPMSSEWNAGIVGSGPNSPGFTTFAPAGHPLALPQLPQGFSLEDGSGCDSNTTSRTTQTLTAISKSSNASYSRQGKRTCGDDKGDPSPSDKDDSKVQKETDSDTADVPQSSIYKTPNEKLAELGGLSATEKAQKKANDAYDLALAADSRASAANEAAGGTGSGTKEQNPSYKDLPTKKQLEDKGQTCLFTATVTYSKATVLGGPQGGNQPNSVGFVGASETQRYDTFTFGTCIEAQQFVCSILDQYNTRQQNQDVNKDEQLPVNAVSICPNYNPPCDNTAPTSTSENPSALPKPIAFDSKDPSGMVITDADPSGYVDKANQVLADGKCHAP